MLLRSFADVKVNHTFDLWQGQLNCLMSKESKLIGFLYVDIEVSISLKIAVEAIFDLNHRYKAFSVAQQ